MHEFSASVYPENQHVEAGMKKLLLIAALCLFLTACGQAVKYPNLFKHDSGFYGKIFPHGSDP
jgi:hypothetical protein